MSRLPNETIRQGETLPLTIEDTQDIPTAQTATIIVKLTVDDLVPTINKTAPFANGAADLTLAASDTGIPDGTYIYQITVVHSDGVIEKYPDADDCEDNECDFPTLTICKALDPGVS